MERKVLPMNLQLFAEEAPAAPAAEAKAETEAATQGAENKEAMDTTYTEADLQAKLKELEDKSKSDLEAAQKKWEKDYNKRLESEKAEAEKLAKLSDEERAKAKFEKEKADFDQRKAEFAKKELEHEVVKQLATEKLDPSFAQFLVGADAESSSENIKNFKAAFNAAVEASVTERLKGNAPAASTETKSNIMEEQIKKYMQL